MLPGVGGNPTMEALDANNEKIRKLAFKECRESHRKCSSKAEAKVRFEEPGVTATPRRGPMPPAEQPIEMERDKNCELLDYDDDLVNAPFDPMNDELPAPAASWDSELDGPSMDVMQSQEHALLGDDLSTTPKAANAESVARMLGGLSPDALDTVAKELTRLLAQATPTPPHPECKRSIFERVLGDLGTMVTKNKNDRWTRET